MKKKELDFRTAFKISSILNRKVKSKYLTKFFGIASPYYINEKKLNEFLVWYKAQRIKELHRKYLSNHAEPGVEYAQKVLQIEEEIREIVEEIKKVYPEFKFIEDEE